MFFFYIYIHILCLKIKKVIGAGPAGIAASHLLTLWKLEHHLIEKTDILGGCRTFEYGGHPFTFGPDIFLHK